MTNMNTEQEKEGRAMGGVVDRIIKEGKPE